MVKEAVVEDRVVCGSCCCADRHAHWCPVARAERERELDELAATRTLVAAFQRLGFLPVPDPLYGLSSRSELARAWAALELSALACVA